MKIPRDISARELRERLKIFGYSESRQKGSHIMLVTYLAGEHHLTVPNHNPVRIGTFAKILNQVSNHFKVSRDEILERLFEQ